MAYTDVEYTRKRMKDALLMGETPKLKKRTAGSQKIPGYGDVFGPINKAFRKKRAEDRAREAREQAAIDKNLDAEIQKYANWEGF
jgi:hypothetical protein